MSATEERTGPVLRQLPLSAKKAVADKIAARSATVARDQFARTFADVLSGRFGGRWDVEWEGTDRPALPADRDGRTFAGEE